MIQSSRFLAALAVVGVVSCAPSLGFAQSGTEQKSDQKQAPATDAAKEEKRKTDEFAEAARVVTGAAGHPECVWLGRRVVNLLWRDDLDTAFRHLDLYDRFGCPGGHVQTTFRCVIRQGNFNIDPKAQESLNARVHACWINPNLQPQSAAASASPGASKQPGEPAAAGQQQSVQPSAQ